MRVNERDDDNADSVLNTPRKAQAKRGGCMTWRPSLEASKSVVYHILAKGWIRTLQSLEQSGHSRTGLVFFLLF